MKPRVWIYIFVLAACVVLILWVHSVRNRGKAKLENQVAQPTNPTSNTNLSEQAVGASNRGAVSSVQATPNASQSNSKSRVEMLRETLGQKNVPIDFYGQVIDQDSNALPGVQIHAYIRHWELTDNAISRPIRIEKETGADGRFEISGETGDGLNIESIQKNGYEAEPTGNSFGSSAGSFENPVIFKMWSTNIHEQLITGEKKFQIVPDGRQYMIDLTEGTIAESGTGDLKVWVRYPAEVVPGQLYDWSSEIDAVNGGFSEETNLNSAMYFAPVDGYTPVFQYNQQIKGGQYGSTGKHRFYVMLNSGKEYGQIAIDLYAPYNDQIPGLIRLSYAINPSGSRILR